LGSGNVTLIPEGIKQFDETGIVSDSGRHEDFNVVVLATGFQVTNFPTPMEIIGKGRALPIKGTGIGSAGLPWDVGPQLP